MTKYYYPTWADILGEQWDHSENWGKPGQGNVYIFNSIIECLNRNTFGDNDVIMILWSSIGRLDYYQLGHWYSKINAFSKDKEIPINCPEGHELTNFSLICAIHELLKLKKIKFRSMSWCQFEADSPGELYKDTIMEIEKFKFNPNHKFFPSYVSSTSYLRTFDTLYNTLKGRDWPSLEKILDDSWEAESLAPNIKQEIHEFKSMVYNENKEFIIINTDSDTHPTPTEHLRVAQLMCPDISIDQTTIDFVENFEQSLRQNRPMKYTSRLPQVRIQI
jgi:hypothetical protein